METFALNEVEIAEYARKQALFLSDIKDWKKNCYSANEKKVNRAKEDKIFYEEAVKREKEKDKKLKIAEKELIRKEKAIAEVTALLVLKGKVQAIWVGRIISA